MKYNYYLLAGILLSMGGSTILTGCSEDYSGQIEILYNLIQGTESRIKDLEDKIKELEQKLDNLEPGSSYDDTAIRAEINNLKSELSNLKNQLNALKQQANANTEAIEKLNKELDAVENKLNLLDKAFANRIQSATFVGTVGQLYYTGGGNTYRVHFKIAIAPYESTSGITAEAWKQYLTLKATKDIDGTKGPEFSVTSVTTSKNEDGNLQLEVEADADFGSISWKNEDGDTFTGYSLNVNINNGKAAGDIERINMDVQGGLHLLFVAADRIDADKDYTFEENGKEIKTAEDSGFLRFNESNTYPMSILGEKLYNNTPYIYIVTYKPVFSGKVTAKSPNGEYKDLEVNYTVVSVYKDRLTDIVALPRAYISIDQHSALYMSKNLWEAETPPATDLENHLVVVKLQAMKGKTSYGAPGYIAVKLTK